MKVTKRSHHHISTNILPIDFQNAMVKQSGPPAWPGPLLFRSLPYLSMWTCITKSIATFSSSLFSSMDVRIGLHSPNSSNFILNSCTILSFKTKPLHNHSLATLILHIQFLFLWAFSILWKQPIFYPLPPISPLIFVSQKVHEQPIRGISIWSLTTHKSGRSYKAFVIVYEIARC